MNLKRFRSQLKLLGEDAPEGSVQAVFSTFDVRDMGNDVTLKSFFTDGQPIAMASWGHMWNNLPPGKGVIRVQEKQALFDGQFFMDTISGQEHYKTIKHLGGLQEWSFGFEVTEKRMGEFDDGNDDQARFLVKGETYEVSPVLIGMNRDTYTQSIKSGQPFTDQLDSTLAVVSSMVERAQSLAGLRAEKGRTLSDRYRERLAKGLADLQGVAAQLDALLKSQEPQEEPDFVQLYAEFLRREAALAGVALEV
jgi:hypothetical protein